VVFELAFVAFGSSTSNFPFQLLFSSDLPYTNKPSRDVLIQSCADRFVLTPIDLTDVKQGFVCLPSIEIAFLTRNSLLAVLTCFALILLATAVVVCSRRVSRQIFILRLDFAMYLLSGLLLLTFGVFVTLLPQQIEFCYLEIIFLDLGQALLVGAMFAKRNYYQIFHQEICKVELSMLKLTPIEELLQQTREAHAAPASVAPSPARAPSVGPADRAPSLPFQPRQQPSYMTPGLASTLLSEKDDQLPSLKSTNSLHTIKPRFDQLSISRMSASSDKGISDYSTPDDSVSSERGFAKSSHSFSSVLGGPSPSYMSPGATAHRASSMSNKANAMFKSAGLDAKILDEEGQRLVAGLRANPRSLAQTLKWFVGLQLLATLTYLAFADMAIESPYRPVCVARVSYLNYISIEFFVYLVLVAVLVYSTFQLHEQVSAMGRETTLLFATACNLFAVKLFELFYFYLTGMSLMNNEYVSEILTAAGAKMYLVVTIWLLWCAPLASVPEAISRPWVQLNDSDKRSSSDRLRSYIRGAGSAGVSDLRLSMSWGAEDAPLFNEAIMIEEQLGFLSRQLAETFQKVGVIDVYVNAERAALASHLARIESLRWDLQRVEAKLSRSSRSDLPREMPTSQ
jgi:hypothetical protein